jgi:RNase P protein component
MIPKSNKFPTRVQFLSFRARAKQLATPHLRVMLDSRSEKDAKIIVESRLSVIVPIKVSKRAVIRNHFKRLAYDAIWKIIKDKNLDCIIMFKPIALLKSKVSDDIILSEITKINV